MDIWSIICLFIWTALTFVIPELTIGVHGGPSCESACTYKVEARKYTCEGHGISCIPKPCCMQGTRHLNLANNNIKGIPLQSFSRFPNIRSLDLRDNVINRIAPGAFLGLMSLTTLDLSGNELTRIKVGSLGGMPNLRHLNLEDNSIRHVDPGAFIGLPMLMYLKINDNQLNSIKPGMFEPLRNLLELQLQDNDIHSMFDGALYGLNRLRRISLADNNLKTVPDLISAFPNLNTVDLESNPLTCDCRLENLRRWYVLKRRQDSSQPFPTCAAPPRLRGYDISTINFPLFCKNVVEPNISKESVHLVPTERPIAEIPSEKPVTGSGTEKTDAPNRDGILGNDLPTSADNKPTKGESVPSDPTVSTVGTKPEKENTDTTTGDINKGNKPSRRPSTSNPTSGGSNNEQSPSRPVVPDIDHPSLPRATARPDITQSGSPHDPNKPFVPDASPTGENTDVTTGGAATNEPGTPKPGGHAHSFDGFPPVIHPDYELSFDGVYTDALPPKRAPPNEQPTYQYPPSETPTESKPSLHNPTPTEPNNEVTTGVNPTNQFPKTEYPTVIGNNNGETPTTDTAADQPSLGNGRPFDGNPSLGHGKPFNGIPFNGNPFDGTSVNGRPLGGDPTLESVNPTFGDVPSSGNGGPFNGYPAVGNGRPNGGSHGNGEPTNGIPGTPSDKLPDTAGPVHGNPSLGNGRPFNGIPFDGNPSPGNDRPTDGTPSSGNGGIGPFDGKPSLGNERPFNGNPSIGNGLLPEKYPTIGNEYPHHEIPLDGRPFEGNPSPGNERPVEHYPSYGRPLNPNNGNSNPGKPNLGHGRPFEGFPLDPFYGDEQPTHAANDEHHTDEHPGHGDYPSHDTPTNGYPTNGVPTPDGRAPDRVPPNGRPTNGIPPHTPGNNPHYPSGGFPDRNPHNPSGGYPPRRQPPSGSPSPELPTHVVPPAGLPPETWGLKGNKMFLDCGIDGHQGDHLGSRVKWLTPSGGVINQRARGRLAVAANGSLVVTRLLDGDTGAYRCIIRNETTTRISLIRLQVACPCGMSEKNGYAEPDIGFGTTIEPPNITPELRQRLACNITPVVVAVVTTFQATVALCSIVFCVWYSRCGNREQWKSRVNAAEQQQAITTVDKGKEASLPSSWRSHSYEAVCSSVETQSSRSTSRTESLSSSCDNINSLNEYVNSNVMRHYSEDYVDLDPQSRTTDDTYSSLTRQSRRAAAAAVANRNKNKISTEST